MSEQALSKEHNCESCKDKKGCISFFAHENAMMHKDMDNERMHKTIKNICITFIAIIIVFVTAYTIRTAIWNNTVLELNKMIVELSERQDTTGDAEVAYEEIRAA